MTARSSLYPLDDVRGAAQVLIIRVGESLTKILSAFSITWLLVMM